MSTDVKLFRSGMAGAPVISGSPGAMIAVLDACLVDGWGLATVDSVVIAAGVATVTIGAGHPFEADTVALIGGATVTGGTINGEQRVLSSTATSYTFAAPGVPDQTASGTITHKVAPLGWEKAFSGTNKAVYRSTDVAGTRMYLRVDDTGTTVARCKGFESMTDVDTGVGGSFPTEAQVAGGTQWPKSGAADATARDWIVFGDSRSFYFHPKPYTTSYNWALTCFFGDVLATKSPDAWACLHAAPVSGVTNTGVGSSSDLSYTVNAPVECWFPRSYTGVGGAVQGARSFALLVRPESSVYSGAVASMPYPNLGDNGLYLSRMTLGETGNFRGWLPGYYASPQDIPTTAFAHREIVAGVEALPGRRLSALKTPRGWVFVDVSGPWR